MATYRCPKCGHEAHVSPGHGREIVSVHCLRHHGAVRAVIELVRMDVVVPTFEARLECELVPAV